MNARIPRQLHGDDRPRLLAFDQLDNWQRDNKYVKKFYRPIMSRHDAFCSIFYIHNETWNIWTHVAAAIYFFVELCRIMWCDNVDNWSYLFCISATICFGCSSTFHTLLCTNEDDLRLFSRMDYTGILILMSTSGACWILLIVPPNGTDLTNYLVIGGLIACVITYMIWSINDFHLPNWRMRRGLLFLGFGALIVVPVTDCLLHDSVEYCVNGLDWSVYFLLFGLVLYISNIPERSCSGRSRRAIFYSDLFSADVMNSHAFFHFYVFLGTANFYNQLIVMSAGVARTRT